MSSGMDNIPPKLLIKIGDMISTPLSIIINQSLYGDSFPSKLKLAKVIPMSKLVTTYCEADYRWMKCHLPRIEVPRLNFVQGIVKLLAAKICVYNAFTSCYIYFETHLAVLFLHLIFTWLSNSQRSLLIRLRNSWTVVVLVQDFTTIFPGLRE